MSGCRRPVFVGKEAMHYSVFFVSSNTFQVNKFYRLIYRGQIYNQRESNYLIRHYLLTSAFTNEINCSLTKIKNKINKILLVYNDQYVSTEIFVSIINRSRSLSLGKYLVFLFTIVNQLLQKIIQLNDYT